MRASILPLDSDEHRIVQALLPWHVNGTLEGSEAERARVHLMSCARCQADAALQDRLRGLQGGEAGSGDVEHGWNALRGRLDAKPPAVQPPPLAARWRTWRWLPLAVGLQGTCLLLVAVALFSSTRQAEPYHALGAAPPIAEANALAVFRPDATEAQIRQALRASGAQLVGGPTVMDAYLIHIPRPGSAALGRLRAQPALLRVESLGETDSR